MAPTVMTRATAAPSSRDLAFPTPTTSVAFAPTTGDLAFVRQGSLWIANTTAGEASLIVPNPYAEEGWNSVAAAPVWHPDGRHLAYLSIYAEDLAAGETADRGYITWVDLEAGRAWRRRDVQVALDGGLAWDVSAPRLVFVSCETDLDGPRAGPVPTTPQGRLYYGFAGDSGLYQIEAPQGPPELLINEQHPSRAYTGPLQFTSSGNIRYVDISNRGVLTIAQFEAATATTEILAILQLDATQRPYSIPTLDLPATSQYLALIMAPLPAIEPWHGLYRLDESGTSPQRLSDAKYSCGLEAGTWEQTVALGCGGGYSDVSPLLLCNVVSGYCQNVMPDILDQIVALTTPAGVQLAALNALKVMPVYWSAEGCLHITVIPYAAGQSWSGRGSLMRFCPVTQELQRVLRDASLSSFRAYIAPLAH